MTKFSSRAMSSLAGARRALRIPLQLDISIEGKGEQRCSYVLGHNSSSQNFTPEQKTQAKMQLWDRHLEYAVNNMEPTFRKAYMSLANSHTQDGSGATLGILRTNGFEAGDLCDPGLARGVYSMVGNQASRINHSCSPNVAMNLDRTTFGMELRAMQKIRKGEEMTTTYGSLVEPRANRRKKLLPYGFTCSCVACADPSSDARRRAIFLGPLRFPIPGLVSLKESLKQMRLIEDQGLESATQYIEILKCVAKAYGKIGNQEKEKEFRKKVYLHALGRDGRADAMQAIKF
ncbi:hypothetical protein OF83DRAFT_1089052 [Amylostereum chailletii]|nr:hypothetical protein OF83DRAFT_1089052 [Amylostereum chailletii]